MYVLHSWSYEATTGAPTIGAAIGDGSGATWWAFAPLSSGTQVLDQEVDTAIWVHDYGTASASYVACYETVTVDSATPQSDAVTAVTGGISSLEPGIVPVLGGLLGLLIVWWAVTWVLRFIHGRER
jgi:hypothetical protein